MIQMKAKILILAVFVVAGFSVTTVASAPYADFSWTPSNPTDLQPVHFIDESQGDIIAWIWYFGDGNSSTEQNPWHQYADNGNYDVRLVIILSDGSILSATKTISIANVPPHAAIGGARTYNVSNVTFISASYDEDGVISSCHWEFGDANTSNGCVVTHEYGKDGIYVVNLTVYDNDGASNKTNATIMVDTTSPSTSYNVSCEGWCKNSVDIELNATDNLSGIDYTKYKIDDGEWKLYNGTITISSEGIHKLYFYSVDNAGNAEDIKNVSIKIDKTKPNVEITIPKQGYLYIANRQIMPTLFHRTIIIGKLNATAKAKDDTSGIAYVEFILNGQPLWKDYVSPYNAELPQELPASFSNVLKVIAYDNAGNYKESNEITYIKIA
ncbi:MAG: PKD domain-containing protein [Thermoplasmata archaeon]|nr:PKD domain-containing protein [Thermoplasmata archaeon]